MASEALFLVLPREGATYDIPPFHTFLYPYMVLCGVDLLIHLRMYADFPGTLGAINAITFNIGPFGLARRCVDLVPAVLLLAVVCGARSFWAHFCRAPCAELFYFAR